MKIDDCIGDEVSKAVASMPSGSICLLENTRFYKEEEKNEASFAKKLAGSATIFVNDAFCRVTGYARDEALGRNCRFLQGPDTEAQSVAVIQAAE